MLLGSFIFALIFMLTQIKFFLLKTFEGFIQNDVGFQAESLILNKNVPDIINYTGIKMRIKYMPQWCHKNFFEEVNSRNVQNKSVA